MISTIVETILCLIMVAIERKIRDKRIKFGRVQTKKLEEWIRIHEEFTYPKAEDLEELVGKTGLSDKQIRVWFTNHRNRKQTRAEICLSRIRYSLQSKSFQRRSKKLKDKLAKETSRYYLSKYYCL
mmetsp:Transcript_27714/g.31886  ORF Transcript_27714/g.31886 Transcript_27714/m.31886 type:complete len:126 (+) Transcript_27714:1010-1387(+)